MQRLKTVRLESPQEDNCLNSQKRELREPKFFFRIKEGKISIIRVMIYYYIFLFILLVIYFLFAYELKLKVSICFDHLIVKVFFIPIIYLKGKRYKRFLRRLIPENKEKMKEEIDISSLITLVHFDYLNIVIEKNVIDYLSYSFLIVGFDILNNMIIYYIKENIKEYNFKIEESEKTNIDINSKFHFNLGIILLNLFIINRRYKNVQKANK